MGNWAGYTFYRGILVEEPSCCFVNVRLTIPLLIEGIGCKNSNLLFIFEF